MSSFLEIRPAGLLQSLNPSADVSEAYGIPSAMDLFCRCGALSASQLAGEGLKGGYGVLTLAPEGEPAPVDANSLKARRLMARQNEGAMLWPLPSAMRPQRGSTQMSSMGEKVQFKPSADATCAAICALRFMASMSQEQESEKGMGNTVS